MTLADGTLTSFGNCQKLGLAWRTWQGRCLEWTRISGIEITISSGSFVDAYKAGPNAVDLNDIDVLLLDVKGAGAYSERGELAVFCRIGRDRSKALGDPQRGQASLTSSNLRQSRCIRRICSAADWCLGSNLTTFHRICEGHGVFQIPSVRMAYLFDPDLGLVVEVLPPV